MKKMILGTAAAVAIIAAPSLAMAQMGAMDRIGASPKAQANNAASSSASGQLDKATPPGTGGDRRSSDASDGRSSADSSADAGAIKSEDAAEMRARAASDERAGDASPKNGRAGDRAGSSDRPRDRSARPDRDRGHGREGRSSLSASASVSGHDRDRKRSVSVRERDRVDVEARSRGGASERSYRSRAESAEIGARRSGPITAEQRTTMRRRFAGSGHATHRVARSTFGRAKIVEGAEVPRTIAVERVPRQVVETVPDYRDYRYFETDDDHVVVVNPKTYRVVTVIEE